MTKPRVVKICDSFMENMLTNRKGFPRFASARFKYDTDAEYKKNETTCDRTNTNFKLFRHQRMVAEFVAPGTPYRGLLLYHGLGAGKTCSAIFASTNFAALGYRIIVLIPASLEGNFVQEVKKCGSDHFKNSNRWRFVPCKTNAEIKALAAEHRVEERAVRANKGVFVAYTAAHTGGATTKPPSARSHSAAATAAPRPSDKAGKAPGTPATAAARAPSAVAQAYKAYADLDEATRAMVDVQIESLVRVAYTFFHYNGLNAAQTNRLVHMLENEKCVVVIDEVHNFISRTCNNPQSFSARVHKTLCHTLHNRVLALSGTPIINYPREIAFLINLVKGCERLHTFTMVASAGAAQLTKAGIAQKLGRVPGVDYVNRADFAAGTLSVRMYNDADDKQVALAMASALEPVGVALNVASVKVRDVLLFPQDEDAFFRAFIDEQKLDLKNQDMFMRRIIGVASYFDYQNTALYPSVSVNEVVECAMSEHQYKRYRDVRLEEIGREEQAAKRAVMNMLDSPGQLYKTFSRMACNYVFPEKIRRPFPSTMKDIDNETDEDSGGSGDTTAKRESAKAPPSSAKPASQAGGDGVVHKSANKRSYEAALQHAIDQVTKKADDYLKTNLRIYSCKFAEAIRRVLKSPGSALIYSQFKTVEGLALFGEVLKAHGYAEIRLHMGKAPHLDISVEDYAKPKFVRFMGDNSQEESQAILDLFNSNLAALPAEIRATALKIAAACGAGAELNLRGKLVSIFMITQSGAEGITLRNVRQVHILEPYWNNIRLDQVLGRAIRICSHSELPPDQRTVEVYKYIAKIPAAFTKLDNKIVEKDSGLSADQMVANIATKKTRVMNEVLTMLKQTSFDCGAHAALHKSVQCYAFPAGGDGDVAYDLDIELDALNTQVKENLVTRGAVRVEIKGKAYLFIKQTKDLFNYALYKRGILRHEGRLVSTVRNGVKGYYATPF